MIDLHTHSLLSDGALLPSELVRRAISNGYKAIAITDHVDFSNIDFVIPRLVKTCKILSRSWKIKIIPGAEITHVPIEEINSLVKFARKNGARIVVGHGETISEPVIKGTNKAFIEAEVDILAHPGLIEDSDALLASKKGVHLEITTRKSHRKPNKRMIRLAKKHGVKLVLNSDSHVPEDLLNVKKRLKFLTGLGLTSKGIRNIINNSEALASRA